MGQSHPERRAHKRYELRCPVTVAGARSPEPLEAWTVNLSDGGALMSLPPGPELRPGQALRLNLRVPRTTPNTYMLEEFSSPAYVVRRPAGEETADRAVAVRFVPALKLELEV